MKRVAVMVSVLVASCLVAAAIAQSPTFTVTSTSPEGGPDLFQFNTSTQGTNGPAFRANAVGDLYSNKSLRLTGSTITGSAPGSLSYMEWIQSDLADGQPVLILQGNISADMDQDLISGWGNGTQRVRVTTKGQQWLRGPNATLEVSKSGGSGPLSMLFTGMPTTTGDGQPIISTDYKSNTGDVVAQSVIRSKIDNSGGQWALRAKQPSGALNDALLLDYTGATVPSLAGAGSTHVCADANGKLFRCP